LFKKIDFVFNCFFFLIQGRLVAKNISAKAYHAGLKNSERDSIQDEWMQGKTKVIVATISFGMGVDKSSVRFVGK
jgi:ATP-dependent DNA helicase Q5